jgi:hypothetical protein
MGSVGICARIVNLGSYGVWSDSRLSCFTPTEEVPDTHFIRDWEGPRAGLESVDRRHICASPENRSLIFHFSARRNIDWAMKSKTDVSPLYYSIENSQLHNLSIKVQFIPHRKHITSPLPHPVNAVQGKIS